MSTPAPTKDSLNFHLGDDTKNCGLCQNWELEEKCSVLQTKTPRSAVCDAFVPIEADTGAPADLGETLPENLTVK